MYQELSICWRSSSFFRQRFFLSVRISQQQGKICLKKTHIQASNSGGAVASKDTEAATLSIHNSSFVKNTADTDGGAVYVSCSSSSLCSVIMMDSNLTKNEASSQGV